MENSVLRDESDFTVDPVCEGCGTAEGVEHMTCPYMQDVHGVEEHCWLCPDCEHQRCMDI